MDRTSIQYEACAIHGLAQSICDRGGCLVAEGKKKLEEL